MTDEKLLGLTEQEAKHLLALHGTNEPVPKKKENILIKILHVLREPMFILLLAAAVIYFVLGEPGDGAIMLLFVIGIISIDVIQEWKTDKTLAALKDLSAPRIKVLRDGQQKTIPSSQLVPGDVMLIEEGVKIPADGFVVKASDLCVDESSLTGESVGVWKLTQGAWDGEDYWRRDYCYAGTLVTQGTAFVKVEKTGRDTEYGKIGADVAAAPDIPTPLQKQTAKLVQICAGIAAVLFAAVSAVTYLNIPDHAVKPRIIESILSGITLAMAMIPEEFPVILTVFLSMGAWRLAKKQSLVRRLPSVETLGAVTVLCVDKTGTITMNKMAVRETYTQEGADCELCEIMGLACETDAYDPMEKAMLEYCEEKGLDRKKLFSGSLLHEFSFTHENKMMGHIWQLPNGIILAAKGSPEKIIPLCGLSEQETKKVYDVLTEMSMRGLRVIAVGAQKLQGQSDIKGSLDEHSLSFCGLIGLADPPRPLVEKNIQACVKAGIRVIMITGDNGITAGAIAKQIGMSGCDNIMTGDELSAMTDEELSEKVKDTAIFSRVIPEHKMRIVKALKSNGEIVAMTGDGVNDAPALKYADIGIAMGKRGSEVSREAADLILLDDNFSTIVHTIRDGRRIYDNIRKAIGYVFTIHIPIAFSCLLAPLMNILPASMMLLPVHVVLLELVIDPTCSIVLERQPAERDIMLRRPRRKDESILTAGLLIKSILQGVVVFAASFGTFLFMLQRFPQDAALARAMGLTVILFANLLLVQVNSSETELMLISFFRLFRDKVMWMVFIGTFIMIYAILYTPVSTFLKLSPLSFGQLAMCAAIACAAVLWYEIVKAIKIAVFKKRT